jgi:hypothetical protein
MAFFHLHAEFILHANGLGGVWRRKRRERLAWTEKKKLLAAFLVV